MSRSISISLLAITCIGFACSNEQGILTFSIDDDRLTIKSTPDKGFDRCDSICFRITYSLTNSTSSTLLLYGINDKVELSFENFPANCDSVRGFSSVGTHLGLYSESNEFIGLDQPSRGYLECVNTERIHEFNLFLRKGMAVIRPGQRLQFVDHLNFRDYRLWSPSKYHIALLYRQVSRPLMEKILGKGQIDADLRMNDAVLFEGCIWSNSVTLIVE